MIPLLTSFRRIKASVRRRGVLQTLALGFRLLFHLLNFANLYAIFRKRKEDRSFDRRFGVDTGGTIPVAGLDVSGQSAEYGRPYVATSPDAFKKMMDRLPINPKDYLFIDFGSGKGRCLLLASDWPFKRIIGVEFSQELHQIAENNIVSYRSPTQRCRRLESVCMDAAAFPIPPEPAVFYFFNPFDEPVMSAVLANIKKSWQEHPRELYILYNNPLQAHVLAGAGFLREVDKGNGYVICKGAGDSNLVFP